MRRLFYFYKTDSLLSVSCTSLSALRLLFSQTLLYGRGIFFKEFKKGLAKRRKLWYIN